MRIFCLFLALFILQIGADCTEKINYPVSLIPDSLLTDAYSVVRLETTRFEYYDQQNGLEKVTRVVTILDEKGSDEADFITYIDKFRELKNFSGEVFDKEGKSIKKLKESDLHTSSISEQLGNDNTNIGYRYSQPTYPYTIKYEYEIKSKNGIILFPRFSPVESFNQSVQQAEYSLQLPAGFKFQLHALNMSDRSVLNNEKGKEEYKWTLHGLKAINEEPFMPELEKLTPSLWSKPVLFYFDKSVGDQENWDNFAKWQWELLKDRDVLSPKAIAKVNEIIAGAPSDKEKVKRLYSLLQKTTRYVSIQLGIGGWQPIAASSVNECGFGDCKGLSNYMRAMLKVAGINSIYTVIHSGGEKKFFPEFASLGQSNHVILLVPLQNDTIPLECTSSLMPFGYIHDDIAGHDALLVTPEGGKLYRLHSYPDSANYTHTTLHIELDNNGIMQAKAYSVYALSDYQEMLKFQKIMNNDDRVKDIQTDYRIPSTKVSNIDIREKHDELPTMTVSYNLSSDTYVNKSGARMFVPLNPHKNSFEFSSRRTRRYPFVIPAGNEESDTIFITIPKGWQVESRPGNLVLKKEFASFTSTITQEGNTLRVIQRLYIPHGEYPAKMNNELKDFFMSVNGAFAAQIVLKTP